MKKLNVVLILVCILSVSIMVPSNDTRFYYGLDVASGSQYVSPPTGLQQYKSGHTMLSWGSITDKDNKVLFSAVVNSSYKTFHIEVMDVNNPGNVSVSNVPISSNNYKEFEIDLKTGTCYSWRARVEGYDGNFSDWVNADGTVANIIDFLH